MKQLLFLLLFPCLAMAQYQGNGNQKITLGEQTTADGLVWRGLASIDTVTATTKITRANKQDTSAYLLLDTVTNLLWHYKIGSNAWIQAGGGVSVSSFSAGTTGLTPSTATTGAVTLGGTLAVANGGTGASVKIFVDTFSNQTVNGLKTFKDSLFLGNVIIGKTKQNNNSVRFGINSLLSTADKSVAIGTNNLQNDTGGENLAIGFEAGKNITTGTRNVLIGSQAGSALTIGESHLAIGATALFTLTGGYENVAIGRAAMEQSTTGAENVAVGQSTLYNNTGNSNTAIGYRAGWANSINNNTTGTNNTFIGNNAVGESATESNRTWIGNTSTVSTWVGGNLLVGTRTNGTARLHVKGSGVDGNTTALKVDNNGNINLLTVLDNGLVGIGETSLSTFQLTVKGTFPILFNTTSTANALTYGGTRFFRNTSTLNNGNGFQYSFNDANGNAAEYGYFGGYIIDNTVGSTDGGFIFAPTLNNSRTEAMRILNNGNVGIGTTAPAARLHVKGSANAAEFALRVEDSGNNNLLSVQNNGATTFTGSVTGASFRPTSSTIPVDGLYLPSPNSIAFSTNGQKAMEINSVGAVGFPTVIGTSKFTIDGNFGFAGSSGNKYLYFPQTGEHTGVFVLQAGFGSSAAGGAINLYGHANSTKPGWVTVGISQGAGTGATEGRFTVNTQGLGGGTDLFTVLRTGNVGIGTTAPAVALHVVGNGLFTGSITTNSLTTNGIVYSNAGTLTNTNPSDSTLKNSINSYTYGLSEILQLKPKTFYYNLDVTRSHLKYGFIAQEVQPIMPDLVRIISNESDKLGLESEGIYVAMVNAIKELSAEIDILKQEIINLKNK